MEKIKRFLQNFQFFPCERDILKFAAKYKIYDLIPLIGEIQMYSFITGDEALKFLSKKQIEYRTKKIFKKSPDLALRGLPKKFYPAKVVSLANFILILKTRNTLTEVNKYRRIISLHLRKTKKYTLYKTKVIVKQILEHPTITKRCTYKKIKTEIIPTAISIVKNNTSNPFLRDNKEKDEEVLYDTRDSNFSNITSN